MLETRPANRFLRGAIAGLSFWLAVAVPAGAQHVVPFARLAGQWAGSGTINLADDTHEPIKCKAAYDVLEEQKKLQINLRCASESYSFDLLASATYAAGKVTGVWSESTRNVAGTLSGRAEDNRFQVVAKAESFNASLTLITHGDRQTVAIKSQDAQADIKGASIILRRN